LPPNKNNKFIPWHKTCLATWWHRKQCLSSWRGCIYKKTKKKTANLLAARWSPMICKDSIQKHLTKVYTTGMMDQLQHAKQTKPCKIMW